MSSDPTALQVIAGILAVVFPFWPLILISALLARPRHPFWAMLVAWAAMLVCWASAQLISVTPLLSFIAEPMSTVLFFAAGVIIAGGLVLSTVLHPHRGASKMRLRSIR